MVTRKITMHLPEELLQSLDETVDETVKERSLTRDEVLIRLLDSGEK